MIKQEKKKEMNEDTKFNIQKLYELLYKTQFQSDYMCLIIDKKSHYDRANKGFYINGIKYKRLLGTNGGIKNSTVVYVSERLHGKLKEKLDCGRNKNKELVPAKLEAYQALICSGSIPVSMPKGIIVVPDCITNFKDDVIMIDDTNSDEPILEFIKDYDITLNESDGYGLMCPALSKRWNEELGGDPNKTVSGVNTRGLPWTKGMLFTFDIHDFAENIAGTYMIKDVWGDMRDVRDAEVILTESMLKLWDSYSSWEDYFDNVKKYNYEFAVSKVAPQQLENERCTNYQFLQSYKLSDEDIDELIDPTLSEIKDVIDGDYRKSLLFLRGMYMNENNVWNDSDNFIKALMVDNRLIEDPYIKSRIYKMIKKKIRQAKIGVLKVKGNFAVIGGDPYSLAQSIFGLKVTGLLKPGECFHKYWSDLDVNKIACFRAPMTSHNNIRTLSPVNRYDVNYWYQYIETCMLLNSWDTTCEALNGADKDGDLFFTTNNRVLIDNYRPLPSIQCVQKKANKKKVTEKDIIKSNKNSFGDAIGATTNVITSQICLQAEFSEDSDEYKALEYRILCGQLFQQNSIDKSKGIIAKPMPSYWKYAKACKNKDTDLQSFNESIVANKKPYFFMYNYNSLKKDYDNYIKDRDLNCQFRFGISLYEMMNSITLDEDERLFQEYFYKYMPVSDSDCVMNKICHKVESFDNFKFTTASTLFDKSILLVDNITYTEKEKSLVNEVYMMYCQFISELMQQIHSENLDATKKQLEILKFRQIFKTECAIVCPDENKLCNILVDLCYGNKNEKQFVWDVCGETIIKNLLSKNNNKFAFPMKDENGDITYCSENFSMKEMEIVTVDDLVINESEELL